MKKIFSLLAAALLIAACTPKEEVGTPFQAGQKVALAASMGGNGAKQMPGKQRVAGVDNGAQIDLTWNEGDQITVKVGDATAVFTLESGAGTANGTFVGEMPASGTNYSVVYPANYNESVLANQTYVANGFSKGLMKMSTKTDGTVDGGFVLSADNALLGLELTGTQALSEIVLTNPATSKNYTLYCAGVTLSSIETLFYLVVPAGEWPNGITVLVKDSEGNEITSFAKESAAIFSATEAMVMPAKEVETVQITSGIGVFSVAADKQVTFSPGNLQYTRSTDTWSFASAQYKVIGTNNVTGGWEEDNYDLEYGYSHNGTAWADKVDLFSWSTTTNNFGVCTSNESGSFVDWGTNKIDKNAPNTWRTLTEDEWKYLRYDRNDASSLCGVASVGSVNGIIFLPDNWTCPAGVTFESGFYANDGAHLYYPHQYIPTDKWSKLEAAGAVFLPAAGSCFSWCFVEEVSYSGYYWSATTDSYYASYLCFGSDRASITRSDRGYCFSVRLVKDL